MQHWCRFMVQRWRADFCSAPEHSRTLKYCTLLSNSSRNSSWLLECSQRRSTKLQIALEVYADTVMCCSCSRQDKLSNHLSVRFTLYFFTHTFPQDWFSLRNVKQMAALLIEMWHPQMIQFFFYDSLKQTMWTESFFSVSHRCGHTLFLCYSNEMKNGQKGIADVIGEPELRKGREEVVHLLSVHGCCSTAVRSAICSAVTTYGCTVRLPVQKTDSFQQLFEKNGSLRSGSFQRAVNPISNSNLWFLQQHKPHLNWTVFFFNK